MSETMSESEPGSIRFLSEAAFQFVDYASDQEGHLESGNAAMAAYVGRRLDQNWRWLDYALTRYIEPRYQREASEDDRSDVEAALAQVPELPSLTPSIDTDPVALARAHLRAAREAIEELIRNSQEAVDVRRAAVCAYVARRSFSGYRVAKYRWFEDLELEDSATISYRWLEA